MKKFLIVVLAAFICLAFTLPAMAKVTVGGRVALDVSYLDESSERTAQQKWISVDGASAPFTNDSTSDFNLVMPWTLNRLNARYTSDDGAISAFVEFRGGGTSDASASAGFMNYSNITWQYTPNANITFGKQTTNFARFIPTQNVGTHVTTILGVGFGNVNHTTARTGVKGYHRFGDMIGLVWGLYDAHLEAPNPGLIQGPVPYRYSAVTGVDGPGTTNFNLWTLPRPSGGLVAVAAETQLPRLDVALPIRFPWGRIEPSFTWSTMEYSNVAAGSDDSYDMWGLSIGGDMNFGMVSFKAEFTWGQNLGGGSYRGAEGGPPITYNDGTNVKIQDTDIMAWFADVGFKFGPNKINLMYGQISYENEGNPTIPIGVDVRETDYTQAFYGISWTIGVAKGFTINPELMFYDFGDNEYMGPFATGSMRGGSGTGGSCTPIDNGKEWLLGVQFMLVF